MDILKSHFFWRTYLGYVSVALVSTILLTALLIKVVSDKEQNGYQVEIQTQAEILGLSVNRPMLTLNYPEVRDIVQTFSKATGIRLTVIDYNGVVLADSHENPFSMGNHLSRPEIRAAIQSGNGQARRYSRTLNESYLYYALPIYTDNELLGVVRAARSIEDLSESIFSQQMSILSYACIVLFVALLVSFYLSYRQTATIEHITSVAQVISKGDFGRRVSESRSLGLKRLAEVINQLARTSAERVALITADRNRLATIFAGMVEGVIDVDQNQKIIHINEAAAKLLEIDITKSIGKPVWQELRNQKVTEAMDEAIESGSVIKTQVNIIRQKEQLVVDLYAASLSDDSGEPIGAVIVLHDVTELKNLERVRTDFVANASHELKTPITAIRGLSETIIGDEDVDKKTALRFMSRIHAQSIRLSQLVGDLMTISRLESIQSKGEFTQINLAELVKSSVQAAEMNKDNVPHRIEHNLPVERVDVQGDRQNLSQLVDNLIDNAVKYTPEGGIIKISLLVEKDQAVFIVEDSGIGISPQYQQRIFERFYRVDKARSQSLGGTGLGLSIVKNIAEKHNGSVSLQSQLGKGSIFTFKMPLANNHS